MKYKRKEWLSARPIAGVWQTFAKRRASLLLAASLMPASAFAACSGDDATNPGSAGTGGKGSGSSSASAGTGGEGSGSTSEADAGVDASSAEAVRTFIATQVGGLANLTVPPDDPSIPVPPDDPSRPGRYQTTPAKAYLGKLLFHDPVRTARIDINAGQPLDLPANTAFGGTVSASDPSVQPVHDATIHTGSCGSCHIGEASGKAGQLLNFNVGGEGRGYTDQNGISFPAGGPRRSSRSSAPSPSSPATRWSMCCRP